MTGPIINPMWFYWISVIDSIKIVLIVFLILIYFVLFVSTICLVMDCDDFEEFHGKIKKIKATYILISAIVLNIGICFIPSSETLIRMEIAKHTSYENVTIVVEKMEEITDHIIHEMKGDK